MEFHFFWYQTDKLPTDHPYQTTNYSYSVQFQAKEKGYNPWKDWNHWCHDVLDTNHVLIIQLPDENDHFVEVYFEINFSKLQIHPHKSQPSVQGLRSLRTFEGEFSQINTTTIGIPDQALSAASKGLLFCTTVNTIQTKSVFSIAKGYWGCG